MSSLPRFENPKFSVQTSATPAPTRNEVHTLREQVKQLERSLTCVLNDGYEVMAMARQQKERADKLAKQVDKLTKRMAKSKAKRKAKRAAKRAAKGKGKGKGTAKPTTPTVALTLRPAQPITKADPPKTKRARKSTRRSRAHRREPSPSGSSSGSSNGSSSSGCSCTYYCHPPPPCTQPRAQTRARISLPSPTRSELDNYPSDEQASEPECSEYEACEGVYEAGYEAGYEEALASEEQYYEY